MRSAALVCRAMQDRTMQPPASRFVAPRAHTSPRNDLRPLLIRTSANLLCSATGWRLPQVSKVAPQLEGAEHVGATFTRDNSQGKDHKHPLANATRVKMLPLIRRGLSAS